MKYKCLAQIAFDHRLTVSATSIDAIADSADISDAAALAAYGVELVARCAGQPSNVATLALWRQFAWEKAGSPKKDFVLRSEALLEAEERLVNALRAASVAGGT